MKHLRLCLLALVSVVVAFPVDAWACACCTHSGQRRVETVKLDSGRLEEIKSLRFGTEAALFLGEADPDVITSIATPASTYTLRAAWQGERLVFTFRDKLGHTGTLALAPSDTMSLFEVDTRDQPDKGQGPPLYKEWKLTAKPSGSGIFTAGLGPAQRLTLILQGSGNSCTSAVDFTHWTLVMQGPKGNYSLFGDLVRTP